MAKYLATFSDSIDDIEITGFITMTDKEMERFEELASSINWDFSYDVKNIDSLDTSSLLFSSGDDLLTRIDFREISNEEYKILNKVFEDGFGVFIGEDYLEEIISEEDDSTIDDDDEIEEDYEDDRDFNDRRKGNKYEDDSDNDY